MGPFYVAIITPVIHYCMGGLEIDADGAVLGSSGQPIKGLYCAGEVAGGVHGNNRLGGNSLLDCVVFGRVAAKAACMYMFGAKDEFRSCPIPSALTARSFCTSGKCLHRPVYNQGRPFSKHLY